MIEIKLYKVDIIRQKISNILDTRDKQQYAFRIRLWDKSDDQQHSLHYSMTLKVYGAKIYGFIV